MRPSDLGCARIIRHVTARRLWREYIGATVEEVSLTTLVACTRAFLLEQLRVSDADADTVTAPSCVACLAAVLDQDGNGLVSVVEMNAVMTPHDAPLFEVLAAVVAAGRVPPVCLPPPPPLHVGYDEQVHWGVHCAMAGVVVVTDDEDGEPAAPVSPPSATTAAAVAATTTTTTAAAAAKAAAVPQMQPPHVQPPSSDSEHRADAATTRRAATRGPIPPPAALVVTGDAGAGLTQFLTVLAHQLRSTGVWTGGVFHATVAPSEGGRHSGNRSILPVRGAVPLYRTPLGGDAAEWAHHYATATWSDRATTTVAHEHASSGSRALSFDDAAVIAVCGAINIPLTASALSTWCADRDVAHPVVVVVDGGMTPVTRLVTELLPCLRCGPGGAGVTLIVGCTMPDGVPALAAQRTWLAATHVRHVVHLAGLAAPDARRLIAQLQPGLSPVDADACAVLCAGKPAVIKAVCGLSLPALRQLLHTMDRVTRSPNSRSASGALGSLLPQAAVSRGRRHANVRLAAAGSGGGGGGSSPVPLHARGESTLENALPLLSLQQLVLSTLASPALGGVAMSLCVHTTFFDEDAALAVAAAVTDPENYGDDAPPVVATDGGDWPSTANTANTAAARDGLQQLSGMGLIVRSGRVWHVPAQVRDVLLQYVPAVVQEQAQNAFVAHCCAVMETAEQLFNAGMTVTAHAVVDGSRHGIQSVLVLGANGQLDRLPLSTQRRACAMVGYEVAHAFVPSSDLVGFATAMLHVSVTDGSDEGVAATAELRMNLQVPCKAMCGRPDDRCTRGCARVSVCVTTRRWMNACVHACACAR